MLRAAELGARHPVLPSMAAAAPSPSPLPSQRESPWRVRPALLVALGLSLLLHLAWSLWPVEEADAPETTVLTATLAEMPPPPKPTVEPVAPTVTKPAKVAKPRQPRAPRRIAAPPAIESPQPAIAAPAASERDSAQSASAAPPPVPAPATDASSIAAAGPSDVPASVPALPPRVDLAYKVFFGTRGFMIGDATYRFEHDGERYRISTVGQARGLAALILRGTGKIESRGRITPAGLKPYEFAIERGSPDKREVAFFDWDAGNVVLHDGGRAQLEPPAFDPLTVLWQPYFSPPSRDDQTFSLATTRRVARYTLSLEGEETISWPRGEVVTQRWHRASDDGKTEAWFWLAPSLHYIPIKMRVTRTSRGTLEVLLDSIRTDAADAPAAATVDEQPTDEGAPARPPDLMQPIPGPDMTGQ